MGGALAASACAPTGDIETQATVDAAIAIVATAEAGDLATAQAQASDTGAAPTPSPPTPTPTPSPGAIATSTTPVESTAAVRSGILASVPDYASVDTEELSRLVSQVYQGRVPKSLQLLLLLTADDQAYVVVAVDTTIESFITAGTVTGYTLPPLRNLPLELDFAQRVIVTDDISLMRPVRVTPTQVIEDPAPFAFTRVEMDTTYIFTGVRIKDAPPSLDHIGFGAATDAFGSRSPDDYLTVVDPHNTEAQVRVAGLTGTVLFPTPGMRSLLGQLLKFTPDDVDRALSKPSLFYEQLVDDEPQMVTISQLAPTVDDPTPKLRQFHGQMVSVQGFAVGSMVRSEDIPVLSGLPVQLTAKLIGIEDQTGAMPIVGISSEDVSRELFGFFRFDLSVYAFNEDQTFAFLIRKEALPTDPITEIEREQPIPTPTIVPLAPTLIPTPTPTLPPVPISTPTITPPTPTPFPAPTPTLPEVPIPTPPLVPPTPTPLFG